MSTVWAVHPIREDIAAALVFGPVRYINERYIYGDEISASTLELPFWFQNNMGLAALDFDPKQDYLLLIGDHLQMIAMAGMLANRHKTFNVLRFDRQIGGYFPVMIDCAPALLKVSA